MENLTEKQQEILDYIIDCMRTEQHMPTMREIASRFGIKSTNAVRGHLEALERKGVITRRANESRGIMVASQYLESGDSQERGIPVIGRVAAGAPIMAAENREGSLAIESLFRNPEGLYALRVQGDSMVKAGILDGDYAIIRHQAEVRDNDIGVAIIDEEATVKRIRFHDGMVELIPENDSYKPRLVNPDETPFRIGGKLAGVHRVLE